MLPESIVLFYKKRFHLGDNWKVYMCSKMCVAQDESRYHDTHFGYSYSVRRATIRSYNVSTNTSVTS